MFSFAEALGQICPASMGKNSKRKVWQWRSILSESDLLLKK